MLRTSRFILLLAACLCGSAAAQVQHSIDWYTVDGGGGTSTGGPHALSATIGQPDAEEVSLCSTDGGSGCINPSYELTGGFWATLPPTSQSETCNGELDCIFRDGFEDLASPDE